MNARYKQRNLASCSSACRKVTSFCFFCWFVEKKKRFRRCHESNLWSNLSFNWAAIAEGHVTSLGQDINPNWIWSEIAMIWVDASPGGTEVSSLTISFSQSKVQHSKESRPLNNESRPSISLNNISLLCTFCAGKWKRCFDIWSMTWFGREKVEKLFIERFHLKVKENMKKKFLKPSWLSGNSKIIPNYWKAWYRLMGADSLL